MRVTPIFSRPPAPDYVEGMSNLRGEVTAMVDLRKRRGTSASEQTTDSRIIVLNTGNAQIGAIVDAVSETLTISDDSIDPASRPAMGTDRSGIIVIARVEAGPVILLDMHDVPGTTAAAIDGATLTEHDIRLVQTTFAKIEPIADAASTPIHDRYSSWTLRPSRCSKASEGIGSARR